jgi:outer membrane protein
MRFVVRCCLCLAAVLLFAPGAVAGEQGAWKVGFVDIQRVLEESKLGRTARADLEKARDRAAVRLERSLEQLRLKEAELSAIENPAARRRAEQKLNKAWTEHDELAGRLQLEMEEEDQRLVSMVLSKANEVLADIAREQGFSMVLQDPDAVGFLAPRADLTDQVIQELDRRMGGGS